MKTSRKLRLHSIIGIIVGCTALLFSACNDTNEPMGKGEVAFEITDAPIDDASVKSVVVTIADVQVDGKSLSGFSKQTIDLKAYQDGNTKLLGSALMDSRVYSGIKLVLDVNTDANGNQPGCYVLTQDGVKYKLKNTVSGTINVVANQSWKGAKDAKTTVVADFDLRKSIRHSDDPAVRYSFVSEENLNAAVRVVTKNSSGTIKGSYQDDANVDADKIIVYAYKKGTFNAAAETQAEGADGVYFKNAVASAEVRQHLQGKAFTLAYLPEGDYELHFAAYAKDNTTGRVHFEAMLQSETTVEGNVGNLIRVNASALVNLSATIKGII